MISSFKHAPEKVDEQKHGPFDIDSKHVFSFEQLREHIDSLEHSEDKLEFVLQQSDFYPCDSLECFQDNGFFQTCSKHGLTIGDLLEQGLILNLLRKKSRINDSFFLDFVLSEMQDKERGSVKFKFKGRDEQVAELYALLKDLLTWPHHLLQRKLLIQTDIEPLTNKKDQPHRKQKSKQKGSTLLRLHFPLAYKFKSLELFFVLNQFPFDVGDEDLRTNLFKGGGNDAILTSLLLRQQANRTSCLENSFDVRAFKGAYLSNQKEFCNKANCSGKLTHQSIFTNWFHHNDIKDQKVMNFAIWLIQDFRRIDMSSLRRELRPNQKVSSYDSKCFRLLSHQGSMSKWNHLKRSWEEIVMNFRSHQTFSSATCSGLNQE